MSSELPSAATGDLVRVELGPRSYEVRVVTGQIKAFGSFARGALERSPAGRSCRKALIVTDANLATRELSAGYEAALYQAGIEAVTTVVPAGESSKSLAQAARLYDELVDFRPTVIPQSSPWAAAWSATWRASWPPPSLAGFPS